MNKKIESGLSWGQMIAAGLRMVPHLGRLLESNYALGKVSPDDYLSTGLVFEKVAQRQPLSTFLMFEEQSWSYGEFNRWVNRIAHLFKSEGVRSGDCVALMFENRPEILACVLAANKLGAIAGMLNHNQRGEVLQHSLGLIKPRLGGCRS